MSNKIRSDFEAAISELRENGERLSIAAVARAAGHSRSLIADDTSKYADIRQKVLCAIQQERERLDKARAGRKGEFDFQKIIRHQQDVIYKQQLQIGELEHQIRMHKRARENLRVRLNEAEGRLALKMPVLRVPERSEREKGP